MLFGIKERKLTQDTFVFVFTRYSVLRSKGSRIKNSRKKNRKEVENTRGR